MFESQANNTEVAFIHFFPSHKMEMLTAKKSVVIIVIMIVVTVIVTTIITMIVIVTAPTKRKNIKY